MRKLHIACIALNLFVLHAEEKRIEYNKTYISDELFFIINYLKQDIPAKYLPNYCKDIAICFNDNKKYINDEILISAIKDLITTFNIIKKHIIICDNSLLISYLEGYLKSIANKEYCNHDINLKNIIVINNQTLAIIFIAKQILINQIIKLEETNLDENNYILRASPTFSTFFTGIVHSTSDGILYSSLITNADIDSTANISDTKLATISTVGKVSNSATTATSSNTNNTIVTRDSSGNFSTAGITLADGTAAAPSLSFISETNSGFYRNGSNSIGASITGTNKLLLETTGLRFVTNFKVDVFAGSNRTLAAATETIRFNTENIDSNNNFDTTTFTYTAPITGTYLVSAQISIDTGALSGGNRSIQFVKNGTPQTSYVLSTNISGSSRGALSISKLINLNSNDTLSVQVTGNTGDIIRANETSLDINLISI